MFRQQDWKRKIQKINELIRDFHRELTHFKVHQYRSYHQAKEWKTQIENLDKHEI